MGAVVVETSIVWLQVSNYMIYGYFQKKNNFLFVWNTQCRIWFLYLTPFGDGPIIEYRQIAETYEVVFSIGKSFHEKLSSWFYTA